MPSSQPTNEDIAELFEQLGMMVEMQGESVFKIRAYQRQRAPSRGCPFPSPRPSLMDKS